MFYKMVLLVVGSRKQELINFHVNKSRRFKTKKSTQKWVLF